MTIKELPMDERPREKMLVHGALSMTNSELLAILLRTGSSDGSALRLAERLLEAQGGLAGLGGSTVEEFEKIKGVGSAKAITILAALELGARVGSIASASRTIIRSAEDVANLLMPRLRYEQREYFMAVLLSTKNHVLKTPVISIGTLNASLVHPRELFRQAINFSAASIILVHNHPSGDPAPSPEDIELTRRMIEAGKLMDIQVLDHVVIGDARYISLKDKGII